MKRHGKPRRRSSLATRIFLGVGIALLLMLGTAVAALGVYANAFFEQITVLRCLSLQ